MIVNINNKEITLKYTFRAMMIYENISEKSFEPKGVTEFIIFFYSTVMASDKDFEMSLEEFINWLDEHNDQLINFIKWIQSTIATNNYLSMKVENEDGEKKS